MAFRPPRFMMSAMARLFLMAAAAIGALASAPAAAAAGNFTLVNGTSLPMTAVSIRRFRAQQWRPLDIAPAAGARAPVTLTDPDCAFDIRAQLANGTTAIWSGVNLCEVKVVRLNREPSGELWVDYD